MARLCVTTSYTADFSGMGDVCAASLRRYAEAWGCDVHVAQGAFVPRPAAWHRVRLIPELLDQGYDFVLWLDADAMFVRFDRDALLEAEDDRDLFLVQMDVPWISKDVPVPNTGVMLARNARWTRDLFDRLWGMEQYVGHPWWENAAMIDAMGYRSLLGGRHEPDPEVLSRIGFMSELWNNSPSVPGASPDAIVRHWGGMQRPLREAGMRQAAREIGLSI